tara:strand:- start:8317 stop:8640 length:324 start_codon:yes stop_codon:yes gene_type:complete
MPNQLEQDFLLEVFYDYLTKHGLPEVELGDCEDIVLQDAGVFKNEKHNKWFSAFYTLWDLSGETYDLAVLNALGIDAKRSVRRNTPQLVDEETGETFDLGGVTILDN